MFRRWNRVAVWSSMIALFLLFLVGGVSPKPPTAPIANPGIAEMMLIPVLLVVVHGPLMSAVCGIVQVISLE